MRQLELFRAIVEQYQKFDFKLERCLMTSDTLAFFKAARSQNEFLSSILIEESSIDAIWFSRPSAGKTTAWEIRLVLPTPLSILENIPNSVSETERNEKLKEVEARLIDLISHRKEAIEEIIAENSGAPDDEDESEDDFIEDDATGSEQRPKGNGRYKSQ